MIAIVKYNAGNIGSVTNALNRLGIENKVTDDPEELKAADKVIFPGVGEAGTAMNYLRERGLDQVIKELKQPVLGICLGMQLMCSHSEEGDTECLGIFDTTVKKFSATAGMKVPHMGWNEIGRIKTAISPDKDVIFKNICTLDDINKSSFDDIRLENDVYYVHSFYAVPNQDASAICDYIVPFASILNKDNFYAMQFHPEKSAGVGEQLLKNFIAIAA
ncbi:imidazole glycerol phosphate synthase subunit HisH [Nonlabens mediterrranea]|uniref:Imidazole glycerol phosphate synthase subunit HisH n=1 Tax=Nonlabens mediterrranea TaxID=1419947 RepID=A0ABS0A319_9FLAO|nr:imidazole glycerol phosphate synthase subunit HisH [Nonlabens mediterrranea]